MRKVVRRALTSGKSNFQGASDPMKFPTNFESLGVFIPERLTPDEKF
jgi:hypothetical protein